MKYPIGKFKVEIRKDLLDTSLSIAKAQIGVREATGHNDGQKVEQYLSSIGLSKGNPYCMAGQYWSFKEACEILKLDSIEIPIIKSGLAVKVFKTAIKGRESVDWIPEINDLLFWVKPNGVNGHVERIIEVIDSIRVYTVAFNTSNGKAGNQREGDGVFQRKRNIAVKLGDMNVLGLLGFVLKEQWN